MFEKNIIFIPSNSFSVISVMHLRRFFENPYRNILVCICAVYLQRKSCKSINCKKWSNLHVHTRIKENPGMKWDDYLFTVRCRFCLCPACVAAAPALKGRGRTRQGCDQASRKKPHQGHNQGPPSPFLKPPLWWQKNFCVVNTTLFCPQRLVEHILDAPLISPPCSHKKPSDGRTSRVILKSFNFTIPPFLSPLLEDDSKNCQRKKEENHQTVFH